MQLVDTLPTDYEIDIFLSYPRLPIDTKWVANLFIPVLERHLHDALGRKPMIFVDYREIKTSDRWADRLNRSLAVSRVLLPVWSVPYFESEWCLTEWSSLLYRETQCGLGCLEEPGTLVSPVKVGDGQSFPVLARATQYEDFSPYFTNRDRYEATDDYLMFEKQIKAWCVTLADRIEHVPDWDPRWLSPEWVDNVMSYSKSSPDLNLNPKARRFPNPSLA